MDYSIAENKIREILSIKEINILQKIVDFLYENFENYNWVGIYIVKGNDLILGPWKGLQATEHVRIPIGSGICGSAAATGKTEIIPDVNVDNRYLSCFISTKSEIVIPIKKEDKIIAEIDIDSDRKDAFSKDDQIFLEKIANMICDLIV